MTIGSLSLFGYAINHPSLRTSNTLLSNPIKGVAHAEVSSSHRPHHTFGLPDNDRSTAPWMEVRV